MSKTSDKLLRLILAHEDRTGEPPKALVLTPHVLAGLRKDHRSSFIYSGDFDAYAFMGVPIRKRRLSLHCISCGAPAERGPCSYCGRDPDEIEVL